LRPGPFAYAAPDSIDEALYLLAQHGDEAKVLAGGQSLIPLMRLRLANPGLVVDITRVSDLDYVRVEAGVLRIGALVRHRKLETVTLSPEWRILPIAARNVAHLPIRFRGTFGGSIAHADPAAELPLVAQTLGAKMHLRSRKAQRVVDCGDFFRSFFTTNLRSDEILTEVALQAPPSGVHTAFLEFSRRPGDFAVVATAALVHVDAAGVCDWCRLGLAGVAATPIRLTSLEGELIGQPFNPRRLDSTVDAAMADFRSLGDVHADTHYRSHLSAVLLKRALHQIAGTLVGEHRKEI
jgi:CO/xanthine dehydrogenase FAD-binding subunit